jgi:hypothetical protein
LHFDIKKASKQKWRRWLKFRGRLYNKSVFFTTFILLFWHYSTSPQRGTMPHSVCYNAADKIVEACVQGKPDQAELTNVVIEIVRLSQQTNSHLVLTDLRAAELGGTISYMYNLPKLVTGAIMSSGSSLFDFKRAFVILPSAPHFTFYETVSRNRGHNTALFHDIEDAKEWLLAG